MCWLQLAIAQEGIGKVDECIISYRRAIELDPEYDLAYFNLGGIYWNQKNKSEAKKVWAEALKRFPRHNLADKLRNEFSSLFEDGEN